MPQITVSSPNIEKFGFSVNFDPKNQKVLFDTASLTEYDNSSGVGALYVLGICFSLVDEAGVTLLEPDWTDPKIEPATGETEYELDLSGVGIDFFFQNYKIIGYIKDADGSIYSTAPIVKKICQPTDMTSSGYVPGVFQVLGNCPGNSLTIKDLTKMVLNGKEPESKTKAGTLYYPTGTISEVDFTGTPFTNNNIYTGQYRIVNTTDAVYNIGDDVYITIVYYTNNVFDITCANRLQDILCCIVDLQRTKEKNCNTAIGERAAQQLAEISTSLLVATVKEQSGLDASTEVAFIKKALNCGCGGSSILHNEFTPSNPQVTTINVTGVGGTSVSSTLNGDTKTFTVTSKIYKVEKADSLDTAFSIEVDNNTANTVKYKISFNYTLLSSTILTAIQNNDALLTQFNSLVNVSNFQVDLTNLDGKCIVDLSETSYFLSQKVPSASSLFQSILINGVTYTPGSPIAVSNTTAIEAYLNGLSLGTFAASYSTSIGGAYFSLLTNTNPNVVTSVSLAIVSVSSESEITVLFQKTTNSLIAFLQAVVDYICELSAVGILLGEKITYCYKDYNMNLVEVELSPEDNQSVFNQAIANALCQMAARISATFTNGITRTITDVVKLGGNLIENTTIVLNDKTFTFSLNGLNSLILAPTSSTFVFKTGSGGSDFVTVNYQRGELIVSEVSTNDDRAAVSYYAIARNSVDSNGRAILGAHYPTTNDNSIPAPANDPDYTAYVRASNDGSGGKGLVETYAHTHNHEGSLDVFDTLIRAKRMTTAEISAIDAGLLVGGEIVFNTTTSKLQCYDGSTWNNLF